MLFRIILKSINKYFLKLIVYIKNTNLVGQSDSVRLFIDTILSWQKQGGYYFFLSEVFLYSDTKHFSTVG
jgi:hypothetical protein